MGTDAAAWEVHRKRLMHATAWELTAITPYETRNNLNMVLLTAALAECVCLAGKSAYPSWQ
jgi:hypothetical protein